MDNFDLWLITDFHFNNLRVLERDFSLSNILSQKILKASVICFFLKEVIAMYISSYIHNQISISKELLSL